MTETTDDIVTVSRAELNELVRGLVGEAISADQIRAADGPVTDETADVLQPIERDLRRFRAEIVDRVGLHSPPTAANLTEILDGILVYIARAIAGRGSLARLRVLDVGGTVGTKEVIECPVCQGVIDPAIAVTGADGRLYHPAHADEAPRVVSDRPPA